MGFSPFLLAPQCLTEKPQAAPANEGPTWLWESSVHLNCLCRPLSWVLAFPKPSYPLSPLSFLDIPCTLSNVLLASPSLSSLFSCPMLAGTPLEQKGLGLGLWPELGSSTWLWTSPDPLSAVLSHPSRKGEKHLIYDHHRSSLPRPTDWGAAKHLGLQI